MRVYRGSTEREKEWIDTFNSLDPSRSGWQIWADVISAMAIALANVNDPDEKRKERREKEYERCMKNLDLQKMGKLLAIITEALEEKTEDFLGKMYMALGMGSHWTGQFFTPANISRMMAEVTIDPEVCKRKIEDHGYISMTDPTCGAGVNLIAACEALFNNGINYQQHVFVTGQDIDRVVAQMCFIQLSLLGCAGYVCVADTLCNPVTGLSELVPNEKEGQDFWYTPMYWTDTWQMRILLQRLGGGRKTQPEKEHYTFYFDFREENEDGRNDQNGGTEDRAC